MSETSAAGAGDGPTAGEQPGLPMFYRRLAALQLDRHGGLSLKVKQDAGYGFAAEAESVLLNTAEFAAAAAHYPIVFTSGESPLPVAALGLRAGQNLFVEPDGAWAGGALVPAYVERYPFLLVRQSDRTGMLLCVDDTSDLLVEDDSRPLFRDGQLTETAERILAYCTAFEQELAATWAFMAAVAEHDLLIPRRAEITLTTGEQLSVDGFCVIDEAKFNELPDEVFLDWRRRGWVALVYWHLASAANWARLATLALEAGPAED